MAFLDLLREGGFIMYPLIICSILVWAVAFERFRFLSQFSKEFHRLHKTAGDLIQADKLHEAKGLCHNAHPLIANPYLILFETGNLEREAWEGRLARRLSETQQGLRRFLWILGTIGTSAPFIGLFGTVVGIIKSFESISQTGKSGFAVVAGGLSEALIATAAGIIVAVMAVVFYNFFQTKLQAVNLDFRNKLQDLSDLL